MSVVISPRGGGLGAAGGGGQELPLTRGLGHLRTQSVRSLDSPTGGVRAQTFPDIGTPGTSVSNQVRHLGATLATLLIFNLSFWHSLNLLSESMILPQGPFLANDEVSIHMQEAFPDIDLMLCSS